MKAADAPTTKRHRHHCATLGAQVDLLRAALEALRVPHRVEDADCWYTCPLAARSVYHLTDDGFQSTLDPEHSACCEDHPRMVCNCGADAHNAAIDAALGIEPPRLAPNSVSAALIAAWTAPLGGTPVS